MSDPHPLSSLRLAKAHIVVDDVHHPTIDDDDVHHLQKVLRVADGEPVSVTDGRGGYRFGVWCRQGFEPTGDVGCMPRSNGVTIGVAIPKQDRPELIVQKSAELGIAKIVFIESERSIVRWTGQRSAKKLGKLRRTAREALRQSRGVWLTDVEGPIPAAELLPTALVAEPGAAVVDLSEQADRLLLVGPEGGWSSSELALAAGSFGLGNTVLRVETAALIIAARAISSSS